MYYIYGTSVYYIYGPGSIKDFRGHSSEAPFDGLLTPIPPSLTGQPAKCKSERERRDHGAGRTSLRLLSISGARVTLFSLGGGRHGYSSHLDRGPVPPSCQTASERGRPVLLHEMCTLEFCLSSLSLPREWQKVTVQKGHATFEQLRDPTPALYKSVYFFNLTNADAFEAGAKPVVEQIGPYSYRYEHAAGAVSLAHTRARAREHTHTHTRTHARTYVY